MATSEQSRQKKLAKKRSKTLKENREKNRRKQEATSLAGRMRLASRHPIEFCKIASSLFTPPGLGPVVLCRMTPKGELAVGFFLIDTGCLGVKDAAGLVTDRSTLAEKLSVTEYESVTPEDGLAMIEQAVAYAKTLGFSPHPDFAKVLPIFGDVDSSLSEREYHFGGEDGRPYYMNGPFEDEGRQRAIINQLSRAVGPDNFDFTCMIEDIQQFKGTRESLNIDASRLVIEEVEDL